MVTPDLPPAMPLLLSACTREGRVLDIKPIMAPSVFCRFQGEFKATGKEIN